MYRSFGTALVILFVLQSSSRGDSPVVAVRSQAPFPPIVAAEADPAGEETVFEVLRGDFHIHTPHSDGRVSPEGRVLEAWRYGYDVIAITDHGNFYAYEEAKPHAEALGLLLLRGIETGIAGQEHIVALDFAADYEPRNPHRWAETEDQENVFYQEQMQRLADAGGYMLYAHPHVGLRETMLWAIERGLLRGIEVKNDVVGQRWNTVESHGTWWYPFALDWALEHDLAVFANSDIHGTRGEESQAVTLLLVEERSVSGVVDAIEANRTIAHFNGMLCAREELLDLMIQNLVEVTTAGEAEGRHGIQVANRGPIPLEATVGMEGESETVLKLDAFESLLIGWDEPLSEVDIVWTNLWVSSEDNLQTTHRLGSGDE